MPKFRSTHPVRDRFRPSLRELEARVVPRALIGDETKLAQ